MADRLPAVTLSAGLTGLSENLAGDTQEHAAMNGRTITILRVDLKYHLVIVSQIISRVMSMDSCISAAGTRHVYMHTLLVGDVTGKALFS